MTRLSVEQSETGRLMRHRAWSETAKAIRTGKIEKPRTCSKCGSPSRIEGHHERYDKPLEVLWLCRTCHRALHAKIRSSIKLEPLDRKAAAHERL